MASLESNKCLPSQTQSWQGFANNLGETGITKLRFRKLKNPINSILIGISQESSQLYLSPCTSRRSITHKGQSDSYLDEIILALTIEIDTLRSLRCKELGSEVRLKIVSRTQKGSFKLVCCSQSERILANADSTKMQWNLCGEETKPQRFLRRVNVKARPRSTPSQNKKVSS